MNPRQALDRPGRREAAQHVRTCSGSLVMFAAFRSGTIRSAQETQVLQAAFRSPFVRVAVLAAWRIHCETVTLATDAQMAAQPPP